MGRWLKWKKECEEMLSVIPLIRDKIKKSKLSLSEKRKAFRWTFKKSFDLMVEIQVADGMEEFERKLLKEWMED